MWVLGAKDDCCSTVLSYFRLSLEKRNVNLRKFHSDSSSCCELFRLSENLSVKVSLRQTKAKPSRSVAVLSQPPSGLPGHISEVQKKKRFDPRGPMFSPVAQPPSAKTSRTWCSVEGKAGAESTLPKDKIPPWPRYQGWSSLVYNPSVFQWRTFHIQPRVASCSCWKQITHHQRWSKKSSDKATVVFFGLVFVGRFHSGAKCTQSSRLILFWVKVMTVISPQVIIALRNSIRQQLSHWIID